MNTTKSSGSISAYKSPTTSSNGLRKSFGPDGCPALVDGSRCGETKNLQIIKEFKRLYEDKMKQIDDIAGGDCIQAKVNLQQEWIKDLTDQNEMLVRVVEELEVEAAERVTLLEKKLHQSAKSAGEKEDLIKQQEKRIKELEGQLKPQECYRKDYKDLEQSMLDMRNALTAEVADKHDTILCLRREVHMLEEQCRKADQQTHFKDDIIKELRKEIKQLKQQQHRTSPDKSRPRSPRKRIHQSKTDPDTTIDHLKDGTIVIRDSETIGDSLHTQTIKEKFTDPQNQTIVYICESIPQKPERNTSNDKNIDSREIRDSDVSMDIPKNVSRNNPNNASQSIDLPRDYLNLSNDVSLNSSLHNLSFVSHSTIQETCVRYSRDILDLLNRSQKNEENNKQFETLKLQESFSPKLEPLSIDEKQLSSRSVELLYENESLKKTQHFFQQQTQKPYNQTENKEKVQKKKKPLFKTPYKPRKPSQTCAMCGNDDATLISILSRNKSSQKNDFNNHLAKEISFNENEIRAFSSPYPPDNYLNTQNFQSDDLNEIKQIFRSDDVESAEDKFEKFEENEKTCSTRYLGSRRSVTSPFYFEPKHHRQQPKPLSTRTLRRNYYPHPARYVEDVSLSVKSQSLPSCNSRLLQSRFNVRPPVIANYNYVGTHCLIEERRKNLALNFDGMMDKRAFCDKYVDCWNCFNNTF